MRRLIDSPDWMVAHFSLKDVFGDSGIVGLSLLDLSERGVARLDTFLMSCRVIGRKAESAFLNIILRRLAASGVRDVTADYVPTPKNALVANFLPCHDFEAGTDGRFRRNLEVAPPVPDTAYPITFKITAKSSVDIVGELA
jgi:predicted enzyme involved in methoxymalonyl-ACP biosynthesis